MAGYLFQRQSAGFHTRAVHAYDRFQKDGLGNHADHSLWADDDLWQIAQSVARRVNLPRMSAQAVGGAVGHNSISLIIPCHRVVGVGGSLTGYAGGVDKKIRLL